MSKLEDKRTLYVSVDVEKKGASFNHPVIQLGVAYGYDINSIKTESYCFDYEDKPFEKRCYDEFWIKNLNILDRIENEAKNPKEEWTRFVNWLNGIEKDNSNIKFVSDNPGYDVEAIDYHLYTEVERLPMRYSSSGKYRSISDPSEQIKGLPRKVREQINIEADKLSKHDHWAPNDAKNILIKFFLVRKEIENIS